MFDMRWLAAVFGVLIVMWLCLIAVIKLGQMIGTHGPEPPGLGGMLFALIVLFVATVLLKGK